MKPFVLALVPLALLAAGISLTPRYDEKRVLRCEVETALSMETTEMTMERDGEPMPSRGGGGGKSESEYKEVHVDEIQSVVEGQLLKVKRTFEELSGSRTSTRGEETRETEIESPIEGLAIVLTPDGDDVTVDVVEGKKPDDEKAFEHEKLASFLDVALATSDVEEGATWELSKEQVLALLRADAHRGLFPPPPREDEGSGEGGGRRGGARGGRGGNDMALFLMADWKGKAKLAAAAEEIDGVTCAVIELELDASGELEMPEGGMRGGGGRRGGMFEPATAPAFGNNYDISLEGKLVFARKERRVVSLDVDGKLSTTLDQEGEGRDGGTFKVHMKREGTFKLAVKVTDATSGGEGTKDEKPGDKK